MSIINLLKNLRFNLRDIFINSKLIKLNKNETFSLISSDCTGGSISHDFHMRFNSPTVNMFFLAKDFLKFIKEPNRYLNASWTQINDNGYCYPIVQLDDIKLFLVHYKTVEDAYNAWNRRKERINWDNVFYIFNDRNECTEEDIAEFDSIPYKKKVCFVHKKELADKYKCAFYIKNKKMEGYVNIMTAYKHRIGIVKNYDKFDWIHFLND